MLDVATTFTLDGIAAVPVRAEVDIHRGLPTFQVVGLPDAAVREARERVRAALVNCGFEFPLRRITVNLAPANLRKAGPGMDLAIAAALLGAAGELQTAPLEGWSLVGELALDGTVRPVRGALAMAEAAAACGGRGIMVPPGNGPEAALAGGVEVRSVASVAELRSLDEGELPGRPARPMELEKNDGAGPDLADLRGQAHLRKALEIAAAGGHGLLMIGPPGAGKSLAARRLPSLLPPLAGSEFLDVARIASACGRGDRLGSARPFRAPHHTVSAAGLVGGGSPPRPGEITLAHRGVLFLDELCEFARPALEALREPMETGEITIARSLGTRTLPARFTLVAAANPCPCGRGENDPDCECTINAARRYRDALSGALVDRIDLVVAVAQPGADELQAAPGESSGVVRERVTVARERMHSRLGPGRTNGDAGSGELARFEVSAPARELLGATHRVDRMSGRAHDRVIRVARTIADLAGSGPVAEEHMAAALQYRRRERK